MKLLSAAPASFFSAASDLQLANAGAEIRQIATASITAFIGTSFQQNNAVLLKRIHRIIRVKPRPCLKPVFCRCRLHVRITPKSGHVVDIPERQVRATLRPEHVQQRAQQNRVYSITSSARVTSVGGTSIPSAVAVIRLLTRSNLVGCSTGRSPGLEPR